MQISLRVRLDTTRDRFCVEFEPGAEGTTRKPIAVEGMRDPLELVLDSEGYLVGLEIPNLKAGLAMMAGVDKPGKPGKIGK